MKLVPGGMSKRFLINDVRVAAATWAMLPKTVEVMVLEEDTNLILTVDREMHLQDEHPIRLMTAIHRARAHPPGSLVKNDKSWYAVVLNLDAEKMCEPDWIATAYQQMFTALEERKIATAAIHLLGTIHGKITVKDAVNLFVTALESKTFASLRQVWLITRAECLKQVRMEITQHSQQSGAG